MSEHILRTTINLNTGAKHTELADLSLRDESEKMKEQPELTEKEKRKQWLESLEVGDIVAHYRAGSSTAIIRQITSINQEYIHLGISRVKVSDGCTADTYIMPVNKSQGIEKKGLPQLTEERKQWLESLKVGDTVNHHSFVITKPGEFKPKAVKITNMNQDRDTINLGLIRVRLSDGCNSDAFISPFEVDDSVRSVRCENNEIHIGSLIINRDHVAYTDLEHQISEDPTSEEETGVAFHFGVVVDKPILIFKGATAKAIRRCLGYSDD